MLAKVVRAVGLLGLLCAVPAPAASGATPKEIDQAIKAGTAALKAFYTKGAAPGAAGAAVGVGQTCLTGLALLEAGVPVNDPVVQTITERIRNASYDQTNTYHIALCLMYLDRYGDPADAARIQILAVRLLVGQTPSGGWTYTCCGAPSGEDAKWLRGLKHTDIPAGKLHPDIEKYGQALAAARPGGANGGDDNSNTQFGVLAVWMARKHGVPVENALELIEKRFVGTQDTRSGNWAYSGPGGGVAIQFGNGSPSMYCAGLLGMATAVARREEKRKGENPKPKPKVDPEKPNDPFYNPPAAAPVAKKEEPKPNDIRDITVQRAFAGLGLTVGDYIRSGKGLLLAQGATAGHGHGDLYFLWSLERVGVIYGIDKIGGFDWYDIGSTALVRTQGNDGAWTISAYGTEVNTSFAVLFLCRSNLARDLSGKVQKDPTSTEMRAGTGPTASDLLPHHSTAPIAAAPIVELPNPTGDEAIALASRLLKSEATDWSKLLASTRDAKGSNNTRTLVLVAKNTDGERKKAAREALAERLCRMTAATLRTMLQANEAELRRAAALACAMKDDKEHIPDLVAAMGDADATVVRAAKAGLKSLTGKEFATAAEWRGWLAKEKK